MFLVGLEFSLPKMIAARTIVFGVGGLQVGFTTLFGVGIALWLGADPAAAILLGGALAMSSTAIALKQLSDGGELNSQHGRLAVGVLLFQDLATLPLLILIGALGNKTDVGLLDVIARTGLAAAAFLVVVFVGRLLLNRFVAWIAATKSAELFLLAVLALIVGTAFVAGEIGLSLPLGAFLAGMIIGEGDFRHQVEDEIRPFRDVLLGLFFLTVGMQIDPKAVLEAPLLLIAALLVFLIAKPIIVYLIVVAMRRSREPGLRTAIILAHGGEFGLLILTLALNAGVIAPNIGQPFLSALVISMALAPIMIQLNGRVVGLITRSDASRGLETPPDEIIDASRDMSDHVILCGCGRVGRLVASVFEASDVPYLAIESDFNQLQLAKRQGHKVVFGDAARRHVLAAGGLKRAKLVVATFDDPYALQRVCHHISHEAPGVQVVVSAKDDQNIESLLNAGASIVLPENLAAGLAVGAEALSYLGLSHDEVASRIDEVRLTLNPGLGAMADANEAFRANDEPGGKC